MCDIYSMCRGMPWSLTHATNYHALLLLQDKGREIIGLIVCYVVLVKIFEKDWS